PEGEYTFSQALKTCASEAGKKAGIAGDKVSEILSAIHPFMVEGREAAKQTEEKKVETSIAVAAIEALKEKGNVQPQQPLTLIDLVTVLGKLDEMKRAAIPPAAGAPPAQRSVLDDLTQLGSTFKTLQDVFGGSNRGEGPAPVYITLPGTDGKGGLPLDTFMAWDQHRWDRHKDEQKFEDSRENARVVRDFIGKLGKAANRLTPKEE
ncbi:unnamed protein product, partial [marine sediment metagenome]